MNKHLILCFLLASPFTLWGQQQLDSISLDGIDLSDVVIIGEEPVEVPAEEFEVLTAEPQVVAESDALMPKAEPTTVADVPAADAAVEMQPEAAVVEADLAEVVVSEQATVADVTVTEPAGDVVTEELAATVEGELVTEPEVAVGAASDVAVVEDLAAITAEETEAVVLDGAEAAEPVVEVVEVDVATLTEESTSEPVQDESAADVMVAAEDTQPEVEIPDVGEAVPVGTEIVLEMPNRFSEEIVSIGEAEKTEEDETISVDFPDEEVRSILRTVADLYDLNIIIPETLQGRTSIKLKNVTWKQVFEVILDPLGFTYVEDRNIIRIKSTEELTAEPVDTRVFVVNFAQASQLQGTISTLVDAAIGGKIQVDNRSNSLVITERPSRMNKIQNTIERLDQPNSQVMIESKFVEVRASGGKDLGIDWSSLGAESGIDFRAGDFVSQINQRNSTPIGGGAPAALPALGFPDLGTLGTLSGNPLDTAVFSASSFSAILRALETKNDIKLVSNPTVVTMDNEKAEIKISREFPQPDFSFNSQTGQREFNGLGEPIDVGITLAVTPTVNAAGFINLNIFPEVSSTSEDRVIEGTAFPIRDVRTAKTRIMIKDGYTLALGGLVSKTETQQDSKVPLLGDIPFFGKLFRNESSSMEETNLIIFITAKTLNPDGTTYREVIDPRLLDAVGHTESDIPGYRLSEEELNVLQEREAARSQTQQEAYRVKMSNSPSE